MLLKDKVAIVTGACGGLGTGITLALAREGAKVAMIDFSNSENGKRVQHILEEEGLTETILIVADVREKTAVFKAVEEVVKTWGTVDIMVNNAGVTSPICLSDIDEEEWDRVMDTNMKGTLFFSQAVIPHMKGKKNGRIINMGSLTGKNGGFISGGVYIASKGAIHSFTYALAKELAPYHITVNAVAPGPINTDMIAKMPKDKVEAMMNFIPLRRLGEPDEIGAAVVFLACDKAGFITGEILDVNGGAHTD